MSLALEFLIIVAQNLCFFAGRDAATRIGSRLRSSITEGITPCTDVLTQMLSRRHSWPLGAEERKNRCAKIEYLVQGDTFEVAYTDADRIDPDEDTLERRDRTVKLHFGDKPIVYPPFPPDDDEVPSYDL